MGEAERVPYDCRLPTADCPLPKNASRPVSRVLYGAGKPARDGHSSGTVVANCLKQPTRMTDPETGLGPCGSVSSLFGFAPGGACRAVRIAASAVRSYRTLSPLPAKAGGLLSVALSLGSPPPDVIRHRISVEPGLSSPEGAAVRPTGAPSLGQASGRVNQRPLAQPREAMAM